MRLFYLRPCGASLTIELTGRVGVDAFGAGWLWVEFRGTNLGRGFACGSHQLEEVFAQDVGLLAVLLAACEVGQLVRIVALVVHLILLIDGSRGLVGGAGDLGDAVGPVGSADGAAGHGLADLEQLLAGPRGARLLVADERKEAAAFHAGRDRRAGDVEQRGGDVDDADHRVDLLGVLEAGAVDEQRDAR